MVRVIVLLCLVTSQLCSCVSLEGLEGRLDSLKEDARSVTRNQSELRSQMDSLTRVLRVPLSGVGVAEASLNADDEPSIVGFIEATSRRNAESLDQILNRIVVRFLFQQVENHSSASNH